MAKAKSKPPDDATAPVKPKKLKKAARLKSFVPGAIFQIKITLLGTKPPVWRRIQIRDCTVAKLHDYIQAAMGWEDEHLHQFKFQDQYIGDPQIVGDTLDDSSFLDSAQIRLSQIASFDAKKTRLVYEYDFGDSWMHEILFECLLEPEPGREYPFCLEGARACPPEDIGGVWGYADFVEAITNKNHRRHGDYLERVDEDFDPEAFDPAEATKAMRQ